MVQLNDELIELLDAEATRRNVSRSAVIRDAVAAYLANAREARIDAAIVAGYSRIPPGSPDAWGDLEAQTEVAASELMQRLDEEERAQGLPPW